MKKIYIAMGGLVAVLSAGGIAANASYSNDCNYNSDGTYTANGQTSANGTMNAAMHCAAQGILPEIVAQRLGVWGDADAKEWAQQIRTLNNEIRLKNEEAAKTAESENAAPNAE